jgi:hypothetical protein
MIQSPALPATVPSETFWQTAADLAGMVRNSRLCDLHGSRHGCDVRAFLSALSDAFSFSFLQQRGPIMDVSHFELIWKPQSPASPIGVSGVDKVFQGYFLEITNLEAVAYSYEVEFVAAPAVVAERSLAGNTLVFVDTPGTNNAPGVLTGAIGDTVFRPSIGTITIPPNGTALIAVVPSAFAGLPQLDNTPIMSSNFEVRGYVRLRLPPVFRRIETPFGTRFIYGAQAANPVRVMLTPQNRANYYTNAGVLADQTQSSLPTASGAAVNLLPPDRPFVFPVDIGVLDLPVLARMEARLAGEDRGMMMAAMMASMDNDEADLAALNKGLAEAGIGMALERRKIKK